MQTAKDIMQAVRNTEERVRDLKAQRAYYMDVATNASAPIGDGIRGGSGGGSRVEAAVLWLADLDRQIKAATDAYTEAYVRASGLIGRLPGSRARRLMNLRYLCGRSWKEIQTEMGYEDKKSAYRLHGWALAEIDRILQSAG